VIWVPALLSVIALCVVVVVVEGRPGPQLSRGRCPSGPVVQDVRETDARGGGDLRSTPAANLRSEAPDTHMQSAVADDTLEERLAIVLGQARNARMCGDSVGVTRARALILELWRLYAGSNRAYGYEVMPTVAYELVCGEMYREASNILEDYFRKRAYPTPGAHGTLIKAYHHDRKYGMLAAYTLDIVPELDPEDRPECAYAIAFARVELGLYLEAETILTASYAYLDGSEYEHQAGTLLAECARLTGAESNNLGVESDLWVSHWQAQLSDLKNTEYVRWKALQVLAHSPSREASEALVMCVSDPIARFRRRAIRAIADRGYLTGVSAIEARLADGDAGVREEAHGALDAIKGPGR